MEIGDDNKKKTKRPAVLPARPLGASRSVARTDYAAITLDTEGINRV